MQKIADTINATLEGVFPFITFYEFAKDFRVSDKTNKYIIPAGCLESEVGCELSSVDYLLPESQHTGKIFYDRLRVVSSETLECNLVERTYSFDVVVWVNKVVSLEDADFCSKEEIMYNHLAKWLLSIEGVVSVGIPEEYKRSPWTWKDVQEFTQHPHVAFRLPMEYQTTICTDEINELVYDVQDC